MLDYLSTDITALIIVIGVVLVAVTVTLLALDIIRDARAEIEARHHRQGVGKDGARHL